MSYVVLARKYRPQTLDDIIGQEHVSRTLRNAIKGGRVAHAYMFNGPRGVGKTTTARFLAKALNCKNGPSEEPCGTCDNCKEIVNGTSVDVQEIDGASNRGIDEIRALRENVKFSAASSKYKIYIIDEAHQITDAAFNALLKTLEEPPDHVVFILATTESQKIPLTILSRCQRYRFRLLSSKEIIANLEKIIKAEGFSVDADALYAITNASGGSMRDALSLLDQAVSFVSGKVTLKDIHDLLGFLPKEIVISFTEAVAAEDSAKILSIIKEITEQGHNVIQFGRDLRDNFRKIMLMKIDKSILEATSEDKIVLEKQLDLFSVEWLVRSGHLISRALDEMKWSDQPRMVFELYMLKLAKPYAAVNELIERLEKLESNMPFEEDVRTPPVSVARTEPVERKELSSYSKISEVPASDSNYKTVQPEKAAKSFGNSKDPNILWVDVVSEFQRARPLMGNVLAGAVLKEVADNYISLGAMNKFQLDGIKRNEVYIEEIIERRFGRSIKLRVVIDNSRPSRSLVAEEDSIEEDIIVVPEESEVPQSLELFTVEEDLSQTNVNEEVPHGLEKIAGKFPGKITRVSKKN